MSRIAIHDASTDTRSLKRKDRNYIPPRSAKKRIARGGRILREQRENSDRTNTKIYRCSRYPPLEIHRCNETKFNENRARGKQTRDLDRVIVDNASRTNEVQRHGGGGGGGDRRRKNNSPKKRVEHPANAIR